jgi:hypothetical protein
MGQFLGMFVAAGNAGNSPRKEVTSNREAGGSSLNRLLDDSPRPAVDLTCHAL